jgi:hypothetical protein
MSLGAASLDAVVDVIDPTVLVTATCSGMTHATFWRRTPEGDVYLRGGISVTGSGSASIVDYDAPQGIPVTYYAQVTDGVSTKSAGPTTTVDMVDRGGDVVYALDSPLFPIPVTVVSIPELQTQVKQDVVQVIGRADPVVVSDVRQYPSGTLTLATLDAAGRRELNALLADGEIIAFCPARADYGIDDTWFLSVGPVVERRLSPLGVIAERHFEMQVQRVAAPPGLPEGS